MHERYESREDLTPGVSKKKTKNQCSENAMKM